MNVGVGKGRQGVGRIGSNADSTWAMFVRSHCGPS